MKTSYTVTSLGVTTTFLSQWKPWSEAWTRDWEIAKSPIQKQLPGMYLRHALIRRMAA